MTDMTNWKQSIQAEMNLHGETFDNVVDCTLTEEELIAEFDSSYGCSEGAPFTLWTANRVYFPVVYDGCEWVESVSRDPDGKPTQHFGGQ